jgi:hypothetical protein
MVIAKLAEMDADAWAGIFETEDAATTALKQYQGRLVDLRGAVRMSLENTRRQSDRSDKKDEWLPPSEAQYRLLTADKAAFVKNAYSTARNAGGNKFSVSSEAAQVAIFGALGIFPDNVRAALEALGVQTPAAPGAVAEVSTAEINKAAQACAAAQSRDRRNRTPG